MEVKEYDHIEIWRGSKRLAVLEKANITFNSFGISINSRLSLPLSFSFSEMYYDVEVTEYSKGKYAEIRVKEK